MKMAELLPLKVYLFTLKMSDIANMLFGFTFLSSLVSWDFFVIVVLIPGNLVQFWVLLYLYAS